MRGRAMIQEPYPEAGVTLRCPNEPASKAGLLTGPEKHENFEAEYRVKVRARFINNGRVWGFHDTAATAHDQEMLAPIHCVTCGADAIIEKWPDYDERYGEYSEYRAERSSDEDHRHD